MSPHSGLGVLLVAFFAGCGATPDDDPDAPRDVRTSTADGSIAELPIVADVDQLDASLLDGAGPAALDAPSDQARDTAHDTPRDRAVDESPPDATSDRSDAAPADRPLAPPLDGGCPAEMSLVQGRVCVDRWEAHIETREMDGGVAAWSPYVNPGTRWVRAVSSVAEVPQGYITGAQSRDACRNAGKRLCALPDWLAACRGPSGLVYPYGNTYARRRCNEGRTPHPVVQFYGTAMGVFTLERMNNPGINQQADSLARTGAFVGCVSADGLADMVGNLHEWIDDPNGTFKGGFYADAEVNGRGCLYTTTAHGFDYRDYSTGFRCCADPR